MVDLSSISIDQNMTAMPHPCRFLLSICLVLSVAEVQGAIYRVKPGGNDNNTGLTWAQAFQTLQKALQVATAGDDIWVAAGTYYPDEGPGLANDLRTLSFDLKSGVRIYGGFNGTELFFSNRNVLLNETILSGEIQQDADSSNNAYHVVRAISVDSTARLNGFTIRDGQANGTDTRRLGGGILVDMASARFTFCTIRFNQAADQGGGIGVRNSGPEGPAFAFCRIHQNSASVGSGISIQDNSNVSLLNCLVSGNGRPTGTGSGGGVNCRDSELLIVNTVVSGNLANAGGGILSRNAGVTIINSTITGNRSVAGGGGMYNHDSSPSIINSIVWGNSAFGSVSNSSAREFNFGVSMPVYQNSITIDPIFMSELDPADAPTQLGDFRLQLCSPAIDAGDAAANSIPIDLDAQPRVQGSTIDAGAYENSSSVNRWNLAANAESWLAEPAFWSQSVEPTICHHVTIVSGYHCQVLSGELAFCKTLDVETGAVFDVEAGGELHVD